MAKIVEQSLFSWDTVDASSEIVRLQRVVDTLPDEELIETLENERKGKRDDYPLRAVWNSVIAGIVCGHGSIASLIRELKRNAELRQVCGFDPLRGEQAVPGDWVFSRFCRKLLWHHDKVEAMFDTLVSRVASLLPDYGTHLGIDGKALPTYGRTDTDADWGVKVYRGKNAEGNRYETVKKWFGYRVHLICDVTHELPVAYEVTRASEAESPKLLPLVERIEQTHPQVLERTETLAGDRGYDDGTDKADLYDAYGIKPLIDTRDMTSSTTEGPMRPLDDTSHDTIYYSPTGDVCCKIKPFEREYEHCFAPMQFMGFEKTRKTLKFRCPAAAYGIECDNRSACQCNCRKRDGAYGRVVRVPLERDRRLFLPIHRHSRGFREGYKQRTAVERVNSRIDNVYGFERHTIRGKRKMTLRIDLAFIVMLATAVAWIEADKKDRLRSLLTAA